MKKAEPLGDERVVYSGRIFELVKQPMKVGEKTIEFETARRAPGTRLLIVKDRKILLTREFRTEHGDYDYRLPGGKVFDSLKEFHAALHGDIVEHAKNAARKECEEEAGIIAKKIEHYYTATAGATVQWDLFYFIVDEFEEHDDGQNLEDGEVIHPEWKTFEEAKELALNGEMKEDRSVGVLLKFLHR